MGLVRYGGYLYPMFFYEGSKAILNSSKLFIELYELHTKRGGGQETKSSTNPTSKQPPPAHAM